MNLNHSFAPLAPVATNLIDRLRHWSRQQGTQPAFYFLDSQQQVSRLTYAELDRQARTVASRLSDLGMNGQRALLSYPSGLDFVVAFFGCLYAGTTAVPVYPPRRNRNMARVDAIIDDAQAAIVLSVHDVIERSKDMRNVTRHRADIPWLATDQISSEFGDNWFPAGLDTDLLAVLQYTSGSTGRPKGVMLTHSNLMHNCSLITHGFESDHNSIGLSWLPTYHDMGLVGGILNPVYVGRPSILMSPMSFLQKPIRWLRGISQFNVSISGGPNFAYALCVDKITKKDCEGLDLSSWKVAFNGAEPIRAATIANFTEKFKPYGFRAETHYPCYGLAESTLIISGADCAAPPLMQTFDNSALEANRVVPVPKDCDSSRRLVASGQVLPSQQVLIVDPHTCEPLPCDQVGEIWVKSESVAQGYWNDDEETQRAFRGTLTKSDFGSFLRTGDLGFFYEDQLFVTGRLKDLMIINGRNLYPHDLEQIAGQAHESTRIGGGVAFSIQSENSEQLVIAQELKREHQKSNPHEIISAIRTTVTDLLDVTPYAIILLKTGRLPKTSSGKVQRRACREKFLSGNLDSIAKWQQCEDVSVADARPMGPVSSSTQARSAAAIGEWLLNRMATRLKIPASQMNVDQSFAHYGLDSIALFGISGELEDWLDRSISPKLLFHYPTIAELSDHLATSNSQESISSSDAQSESEEVNVLTKSAENASCETISHELSHAQRALWFIYQMDRVSSAYNIMYALRVRADLDRDAFCRAFQTILDRHEVFRTTYTAHNGSPFRNVHRHQEFILQTIDARCWTRERLDDQIQSLADEPFDLENGPVFRACLFDRNDSEHILLLTIHHIAFDFWSFDLLFDELESVYREEITGAEISSPVAIVQYSEFIRGQKQLLDGEDGVRMKRYWHKQLAGELPVIDLPTDHPRPTNQSFNGHSFHFKLANELTNELNELSKTEGATLFATMLAAFQVLLHRYSGQEDILVGSPTTGRMQSEFENVFGCCINPVVLRARISPGETFAAFLAQVRATLVGAILHQEYPFPLLVEELQPPRDASRSPIFQVAFAWDKPRKLQPHAFSGGNENSNGKPNDPAALGLAPFALGQQGSAFDLMLMVLDAGDRVSASFQYNADLFSESTIARLVGHFQYLLEGVVDNPLCPIAEIPLLTENDQRLLIENNNDTVAEFPRVCVHQMFESQVKLTPDAVAVECGGQKLTYGQLNQRANQVANYLVGLGVGADDLVGVFVERSIEMLIGLLGVLKAGGAYVPFSPDTPRDRLAYVLKDTQASVVLTQKTLAGVLPKGPVNTVCLDTDWPIIANENDADLGPRAEPPNLAYVIYTSGSTGKPKGVQIEHRAVVNFLTAMHQQPGINCDDVMLAVTTITFDISVLELFLPIMVGAKVVVVCPGVIADGIQLAKAIVDTETTIMQATPATWRMLIAAGWTGDQRIKVLCGGEALPPELAEQLLRRCGSLWNMYGPTETTIWSAIDFVQRISDPMPLGSPIANTQIYVLDKYLQPVPLGVTGELYIGGVGLARGYFGQSELTAERFVKNPFCLNDGARLYKTGDLARLRSDGKLEFLGREDFQVKVRGFRIELGEIEAHLSNHPEITQAVVTARKCNSQIEDKQLVAHFTHRGNNGPSTSDLREFLRQKVPDYMVPAAFVAMRVLPCNSAGKLDRGALPEPNSERPNLRSAFVAPRNEREQKLAEIWARVLGLDEVGIEDNFFELGGASMQSLEITALADEVGIEMLPASLFKHPTIKGLSVNGLLQTKKFVVDDQAKRDTTVEQEAPETATKILSKQQTDKTNIVIESIGVYLPARSVTTKEIIAGCKQNVWFPLEHLTGIKSRRVAADDESTVDLACRAVEQCLDNSKYTSDQIDLIVCCHINRAADPRSAMLEPATALYLKQRFQFPNSIAFDITNACAGMFTGIGIAESYIKTGVARRAMVVSAEYLSPVTTTAQQEVSDFMDQRIACLTLGDAAAAIILEASPNNDVGFHELEMYSLSKYSRMCVGKPTENEFGGPILHVPDPIRHTTIAIENSIAHTKSLLDRSQWEPEMFQWVVMHQTSERSLLDGARAINNTFKKKICTNDNTINNLSQRGNTASTSHFVAVWDNILNGNIQEGDNVFFGITGSGQTIGTGIYTFDNLPERIRQQIKTEKSCTNGLPVTRTISPVSYNLATRVRAASVGVVDPKCKTPVETIPLVMEAVKNCLAKSEYDKSEIDLLLFAGVYRSHFISEPAMAAIIADELAINHDAKPTDKQRTFAFDIINGGLGLLSACDVATQMLRSGKVRTAMIVAAEIENNRDHYPDQLLGIKETASAMILDNSTHGAEGFGEFVFKYMPAMLHARTVTGRYTKGGPPCVYLEQDPVAADLYLQMIPDCVNQLLVREQLKMSQIDIVMPPQFSSDFLNDLSRVLKIPRTRFVDLTLDGKDWFTSALPYSMHEIESRGLAKCGDIGLVINVGAGMQVGCSVYYF